MILKILLTLIITSGILFSTFNYLDLNKHNKTLIYQLERLKLENSNQKRLSDSLVNKLKTIERIKSINDKTLITHSDLDVLINSNLPKVVSTFKKNFNYKVDTTGLKLYTLGIIMTESKLRVHSVNSESGASGLGQMLPSTKRIVERKILRETTGKSTAHSSILLTMLYLTYNHRSYKTWDKATLAYLFGSPKQTNFGRLYLNTVKSNSKKGLKIINETDTNS